MPANGARAQPIIRITSLSKSYTEGGKTRRILDGVNLTIKTGEFFVLLGKSGSGKSTLLNLMSGIDREESGQIIIAGTEITALDERQRTLFRRDHIGIIFQSFNLIPTLTILENITLPRDLRGDSKRASEQKARELLARVGLGDRAEDFHDRLSGGEQQRVAIARALVHEPAVVLADEPTGNLDDETGRRILQLLLELTRDAGKTLVMATHNPEIIPLADRVCRIRDGQLIVTSQDAQNRVLEV